MSYDLSPEPFELSPEPPPVAHALAPSATTTARPTAEPACRLEKTGDDHGDHEQKPDRHVDHVRGDIRETEGAAKRADEHHSRDHAGERSTAAEDRYASDEHCGDDGEFEARCVVAARGVVVKGEEQAGEGGDAAGRHEQPELEARHSDARE